MRRPSLPAAAAVFLLCSTALTLAQTTPPPAPPAAAPAPAAVPAAPAASADPVVARVGGDEIRASELSDAAQALPEELRNMPPQVLFPMLLDQLVDRHVIVVAARKQGLEQDLAVRRQVARATDSALQNALLTREIAPTLTEAAIRARYERDVAGKTGEEEVRARHILVADEEKAKAIIAELAAGGDFAEIARKNSTDHGAANGGDLGFFKKADMLPEFSDAAFALKPGEITPAPVKTRFGWHVIKVEERRSAPPPTFEQVRDELRQTLIQEGVARVLTEAKAGVAIEKFNRDGTPQEAAPAPPAAPVPPAALAPAR